MALDGDEVDDDDDRDMFCIPRYVLHFVEKAVYRSLSVQSPSQRFVEKAVHRSPCNRARIDFHDCWTCGRHPSGLWPSSFATARGFGPARLAWALLCSKRPLSTHHSQEPRDVHRIAALVAASLRFLDNVLLVGALHLRTLRTRAVQRWIQ